MKVVVIHPFADIDDFAKKYSIGEIIEVTENRASNLVKRGLAKMEGSSGIEGNTINLSKNWQQVIAGVKECSDLSILNDSTRIESESEKPRPSVLSAIQERIDELSKG